MSEVTDIIMRALALHFVFPADPKSMSVKELKVLVRAAAENVERGLTANGYVIDPALISTREADPQWLATLFTCPRCGIDFSKSMGYVCSNIGCPVQPSVTS